MKKILLLIIFTSALCSCGRRSAKAPEVPPVPVEVAAVEVESIPVELKAIGAVEPIASVQIKSKVEGEIVKVHFEDGAQVKEGDDLFSIDPRSFEAALKRAQANLSVAQSAASNATEQVERYTSLIKSGVASKEQFSQYQTTAESQQSVLAARQADVDEAQLSIEWARIKAPLSGRMGRALLKAGNIVTANGDPLAILNQMRPIYVSFSLPENSLSDVRKWMEKGKPSVRAYEPDTGRLLGTGELIFIDNAVDRASGMITFKAAFPNADETLWPGQFVDVTVQLAEEPDAIVIPSTAVMEGQQGAQVFVVEGGTATLRKVTVERIYGGLSVIQEGLTVGEQVIITGQLRVTSGGRIAVRESEKSANKDEASR